jgi:hypothetical protein
MRRDRNSIKVHMEYAGSPMCGVQWSVYQPHQMTDAWSLVTCLRCKGRWLKGRRVMDRSVLSMAETVESK